MASSKSAVGRFSEAVLEPDLASAQQQRQQQQQRCDIRPCVNPGVRFEDEHEEEDKDNEKDGEMNMNEGEEEKDEEESGESRPVVSRKPPERPTPEEMRIHRLTHYPFRSWCPVCIQASAKDAPHASRSGPKHDMPVFFRLCIFRYKI